MTLCVFDDGSFVGEMCDEAASSAGTDEEATAIMLSASRKQRTWCEKKKAGTSRRMNLGTKHEE